MGSIQQFGPFEACGQYVRTKRTTSGSGGWLVADCPVLNGNAAEHAQLFAAAPELLEALQRIANGQEMTGEFTHAETVLRYQEIARAAIAKATGEAARDAAVDAQSAKFREICRAGQFVPDAKKDGAAQ